jgi:hypothetical protein
MRIENKLIQRRIIDVVWLVEKGPLAGGRYHASMVRLRQYTLDDQTALGNVEKEYTAYNGVEFMLVQYTYIITTDHIA